jgi:pimeloyl-ACP methyl ester carboxylesterase
MAHIQYVLQSGRKVGVAAFGDPIAEQVVVFCHSDPGSAIFDPDPLVTNQRIRLIAVDRPGYGSTPPLAPGVWPSLDGAADELAEFLRDEEVTAQGLGLPDFRSVALVGWSGGGRVALALAARLPDLVSKVALVGTAAPHDEVPWLTQERADTLAHLPQDPAAAMASLTGTLEGAGVGVVPDDEEEPVPLSHLGITRIDVRALTAPGLEDRLQGMLRAAYEQGATGLAGDLIAAAVRPWGFDLSDVAAPVLLVYGEGDPVIDARHGTWYRDHLSRATLETMPGVGRLAIAPAWKRILDFLA